METQDSTISSATSTDDKKSHNPTSTSSPLPPSVARLWRPAAQRNLRNQWSKLASFRQQWSSISSTARSHAIDLVNAHLSHRYMPMMKLGVLSDMSDIRRKACAKLLKQQELYRSKLLSSYKEMVVVVINMISHSRSLRCFRRGTSSSTLIQFSNYSEDETDLGDGGGMPVFAFWPIYSHEEVADELVQMFVTELSLKRLLVVEFLSIGLKPSSVKRLKWKDELYPGEFDNLSSCNLFSEETHEPIYPRMRTCNCEMSAIKCNNQPDQEVLQVYLTTWLAEINIDTSRVEEIFSMAGDEMHVAIS